MRGSEMATMIAIFLGVFVVLLGSARLPAIYKIGEESRRKTLHIAAGILGMGLPALFARSVPVIILCSAVLVMLIALRFSKKRVYDTDRVSYGELCIPVAAAFLFTVAAGDAIAYYVPLMILTFADCAAAMVGQWWQRKHVGLVTGEKTIAGSFAFFVLAFLITVGSLAQFAGDDSGRSLAIAFIVAIHLTILEALCHYGLDNLLVPVAGFLLLHNLRRADEAEVLVYLVSAGMVAVFVAFNTAARAATSRVEKTRTQ